MRVLTSLLLFSALAACSPDSEAPPAQANSDMGSTEEPDASLPAPTQVRVATYNASLFGAVDGGLKSRLEGGTDPAAQRIAAVLQEVRPDVVLLNEFDWDADGAAAELFITEYLAVGQEGGEPLTYAHRFAPPTNTGEHSGVDLNGDGTTESTPGGRAYGDDAFGYGEFPGQYGMLVLSRYPIRTDQIRTFQRLLWKDMPDNQQPTDWHSEAAVEVMRLSSKNHIDVPIEVDGDTIHLLASHPTPPSFDGDEDRNGRRNHDEIRLWVDYLNPSAAAYIEDDSGVAGGLADDAAFVIVGDLNCDPVDGESRREALVDLLGHERVQDTMPTSDGAAAAGPADGRANDDHVGDHALDTADFTDSAVGNLRVDYALPSANREVVDSGVYWPADGAGADRVRGSDHRLVWVDLLTAP